MGRAVRGGKRRTCRSEKRKRFQPLKQKSDKLEKEMVFDRPIVTEVTPISEFYSAEDYHQYYFDKNPGNPYCMAVAAPKAAKIRAKYAQLIKD